MHVRIAAVAITSALVVAATVGSTTGAAAAGSLTITPPRDTVLYGGCYEYPYTYSVAAPSQDWSVDITLEDPFGAVESTDYVSDLDPSSGEESFFLCGDGIDDPGTYTVKAVLTWYDAGYNKTVEPTVVVPFTLAKPATRTHLRASTTRPAYNARITFKVKSTEQGRLGYSRLSGARVRLEAYLGGRWRKVEASRSDSDGVTRFRYRWNTRRAKVKVRAVTKGGATLWSSKSTRVIVRVR